VNEVRERPQMSEKIAHIEVGRIIPNPAQPRAHFDPQALRELASSIAQQQKTYTVALTANQPNFLHTAELTIMSNIRIYHS